jgi:RNA polymerase sigma-70 factor (ECF subfamily)
MASPRSDALSVDEPEPVPGDGVTRAVDPAPEGAEADGGGPVHEGEPDDHDLIRRAQAGEEDAFAALVRRYERRAFRVARNLVPSREDALDLAQEAFLRVFRSLDRFDFRHEFTTWLYRIVTNLAIDHLRKRRPAVSTSGLGAEEEVELDLPDTDAAAPSDFIESAETADRVRACIDSLAPHFQAVLTLRELEGLPCTEIADIVGATHVTVRWRLHRGRKLFQDEWERRERSAQRVSGEPAAPGIPRGPNAGVSDS